VHDHAGRRSAGCGRAPLVLALQRCHSLSASRARRRARYRARRKKLVGRANRIGVASRFLRRRVDRRARGWVCAARPCRSSTGARSQRRRSRRFNVGIRPSSSIPTAGSPAPPERSGPGGATPTQISGDGLTLERLKHAFLMPLPIDELAKLSIQHGSHRCSSLTHRGATRWNPRS